MKLLLDQNISYKLVKSIEQSFPGSQQVRRLGLENSSDRAIWEFAKKDEFRGIHREGAEARRPAEDIGIKLIVSSCITVRQPISF
ncbi:hypothetical protein BH09BAC3_BH09BAC3_09280 [soil metagenome]